jgi:hypothetical protein
MEKKVKKYLKPKIKSKKTKIEIMFGRGWLEDMLLAQCPGPPTCSSCARSCFLPGTKISVPSGLMSIESIKVNDLVLSFNFSQDKLTPSKVKKVLTDKVDHYLIINNKIRVTPYHRFWVNGRKWIIAKDLKVNDCLFGFNKQKIKIKNIEKINKQATVYNLHLFGVHKNFFAEGVLVHNTKCYP